MQEKINIFNIYSVQGCVTPHSVNNVWEIRINGLKNCKGLFNYFDKYELITIKKNSYLKWKLIYFRLINKDHLNNKFIKELIELSKQINKTTI